MHSRPRGFWQGPGRKGIDVALGDQALVGEYECMPAFGPGREAPGDPLLLVGDVRIVHVGSGCACAVCAGELVEEHEARVAEVEGVGKAGKARRLTRACEARTYGKDGARSAGGSRIDVEADRGGKGFIIGCGVHGAAARLGEHFQELVGRPMGRLVVATQRKEAYACVVQRLRPHRPRVDGLGAAVVRQIAYLDHEFYASLNKLPGELADDIDGYRIRVFPGAVGDGPLRVAHDCEAPGPAGVTGCSDRRGAYYIASASASREHEASGNNCKPGDSFLRADHG